MVRHLRSSKLCGTVTKFWKHLHCFQNLWRAQKRHRTFFVRYVDKSVDTVDNGQSYKIRSNCSPRETDTSFADKNISKRALKDKRPLELCCLLKPNLPSQARTRRPNCGVQSWKTAVCIISVSFTRYCIYIIICYLSNILCVVTREIGTPPRPRDSEYKQLLGAKDAPGAKYLASMGFCGSLCGLNLW